MSRRRVIRNFLPDLRWPRAQRELQVRNAMFGIDAVDLEIAIEAVRDFVEFPTTEDGQTAGEWLSDDALAIVGSNLLVAQRLRLLAERDPR